MKQFEQPAFGTPVRLRGYHLRRELAARLQPPILCRAGFRAYGGEWEPPVMREDWIFTPSIALAYKPNAHWSADLAYSYDWADSLIPNKEGREFTRNLVSLG